MNLRAPPAAAVAISFSLAQVGARSVCLALFFNDWPSKSARGIHFPWSGSALRGPPLVRALVRLIETKPAFWSGEISVRPGWCEYLFLVDGAWVLDPDASEKCPDGDGDFSSARWIEAIATPEILPSLPGGFALRRHGGAARRSAA